MESTFRNRSIARLSSLTTLQLVLVGAVSIFVIQYLISACLGRIFGYPPRSIDLFAGRALWLKILWIVALAPLYETFLCQWALIKFIHGPLRRSWLFAGGVSTVIFGFGHGFTDWRALSLVSTASIFAAIFIIEAKRSGPAFRATFLTHALYNGFAVAYNA